MQLNREIKHENVIALREVMLEDKSIYMVFEYAEHDFLVGRCVRTI
jgi:cyclin-dependent kinase 8/11